MAKRKSKAAKIRNVAKSEGLMAPVPADKMAELERQSVINLQWCEYLGAGLPKVNNIAVVQALSYELIQVVNRLTLQDAGLIPTGGDDA